MTSTPVADVNAYFTNYASAKVTGSGNDAVNHFQDVLRQQTGNEPEMVNKPETVNKPMVRTESRNGMPNMQQRGKTLQEKTELTEEEISQAVEEAATWMLTRVAQELNLTVEETENLLEELHLDTTDLLNPETIPFVVLKAAGGTDMMELITNQDLYASVQSLMEELQVTEENLLQETGLSEEELTQFLENFAEVPNEELPVEEPMAEVRTQEPVKEPKTEEVLDESSEVTKQTPEVTVEKQTQPKNHSESNLHKEQTDNPFAQNVSLVKENVETPNAVAQSFTTGTTGQIMNQIMDYMNVALKPDMAELEMQLHPESLGKVNVHISAKEGVITAQFTAQNETVKTALESQMIQLKENFTQQGIKVEAIEVTVENHGFERNMNQNGQTGTHGQEGKKSRPRKLQMDLLQDVELEELPEEEQLAVRMMEQNGNTVDYTA